jgi:predicted dehydrogenase
LADTLEECDRIIAAVRAAGVQLLVGRLPLGFPGTLAANSPECAVR